MLYYKKENKQHSQHLRKNLTSAQALLWTRLRRKQLNNVQFYRQKPILNYIIDFYAPSVKLVIEIDGGQHYEEKNMAYDKKRDEELTKLNLKILRFSNLEILNSIEDVLLVIFNEICAYKKS